MSLIEHLKLIEERMNTAFLQDKFRTFNMLASDRLRLLQKAQLSPEKDQVFALAQQQTSRWVELLENRVLQQRQVQQRKNRISGAYSRGSQINSGRVFRRSY